MFTAYDPEGRPVTVIESRAPVYVEPRSSVDEPTPKQSRFNYEASEYRDLCWLLLFVAHLIGMGVIAGVYGGALIDEMRRTDGSGRTGVRGEALGVLLACAGAAIVFSVVWLSVMQRYSEEIIRINMVITIVFMSATMLACFISGLAGMGIVYLLFLVLTLLYFYWVRFFIPFAQATLATSVEAIKKYPGPVYVTYVVTLLQVVWLVFWAFTLGAVLHRWDTHGGGNNFAVFGLLISLYWTSQVLKNVAHVTSAGVVGTWWLNPAAESATGPSLARACTTSLGSICLGSLLVAVLRAMRAMLNGSRQNCGNVCVMCLLECIERMVQYFNVYAFSHVALYGKNFVQAATDTWEMFKATGFTMIINDDLTGMVFGVGCAIGGFVSCLVAALWAAVSFPDAITEFALLGFVIGFVVTALFMTVLESSVATTYVLWAEDPAALAANRPEQFHRLRQAAAAIYPSFGAGGVF